MAIFVLIFCTFGLQNTLMSKAKPIQITIPKPCSEEWNKMSSTEKGRFCNSCQKEVIDFTHWSDTALYNFFNQERKTKVCGHFLESQVNRDIIIRPQPQSILYRVFIGLGLTLLFTKPKISEGKPYSPIVTESPLYNSQNTNDSSGKKIKGTVYDISNKPVAEAAVYLYENDTAIKRMVMTDRFGYYSIDNIEPGNYRISGDNLKGYGSSKVCITIKENETTKFDIYLSKQRFEYRPKGGKSITGGEETVHPKTKKRRWR